VLLILTLETGGTSAAWPPNIEAAASMIVLMKDGRIEILLADNDRRQVRLGLKRQLETPGRTNPSLGIRRLLVEKVDEILKLPLATLLLDLGLDGFCE
jgi:hypothetical protein